MLTRVSPAIFLLVGLVASLALFVPAASANGVPQIDLPLVPGSAVPGGPGFTLTIRGSGFVAGSVVNWNGSPRATTFVSSATLTAAILTSDIAAATTATITVKNPAPGGGVSNAAYFEVTTPTASVTMAAYVLAKLPVGSSPPISVTQNGFAVADFNNDGKLDIAFIGGRDGSANLIGVVALGNGDGTFQKAIPLPAVNIAPDLVADVNGDGILDLVQVSGGPSASAVLLGKGDGSFQAPIPFTVWPTPIFLPAVLGDFDGDGKLDLAVVGPNPNGVNMQPLIVFPGNGDGTFGAALPSITLPESHASQVFAADLNGDGKLDLAVCQTFGTGTGPLFAFLGNQDGTFQPQITSPNPACGMSSALADVTGDGKLDILNWDFLAPHPGGVEVFPGSGDGSFQSSPAAIVNVVTVPAGLGALTDLNGDGILDLFGRPPEDLGTINGPPPDPAGLGVNLGNGDGTFQPEVFVAGNSGVHLYAAGSGDFNGDGKMDMIAVDDSGNLWVLIQGLVRAGSASPTSLSFGSQSVGIPSAPQTVTLTNTGTATLTFSGSGIGISGTDAAMFSETSTCGASLPAGATCQVQVVFTPTAAGATTAILTIVDDGINGPQTVPLSGGGEDFSMAASGAASATVTAGQTANYTLAFSATGGFNATVTLSCSGAPAASTCTVTPSSLPLNGTSTPTATVTVTTTARSAGFVLPLGTAGPARRNYRPMPLLTGLLAMIVIVSLFLWRQEQARLRGTPALAFALLLCAGMTLTSCGGSASNSGGGGTSGTQAGTYTITVSGGFVSGSATLTHATKLTLVVQ